MLRIYPIGSVLGAEGFLLAHVILRYRPNDNLEVLPQPFIACRRLHPIVDNSREMYRKSRPVARQKDVATARAKPDADIATLVFRPSERRFRLSDMHPPYGRTLHRRVHDSYSQDNVHPNRFDIKRLKTIVNFRNFQDSSRDSVSEKLDVKVRRRLRVTIYPVIINFVFFCLVRSRRAVANFNDKHRISGSFFQRNPVNLEMPNRILDALLDHRREVVPHWLPTDNLFARFNLAVVACANHQVSSTRVGEGRYLLPKLASKFTSLCRQKYLRTLQFPERILISGRERSKKLLGRKALEVHCVANSPLGGGDAARAPLYQSPRAKSVERGRNGQQKGVRGEQFRAPFREPSGRPAEFFPAHHVDSETAVAQNTQTE